MHSAHSGVFSRWILSSDFQLKSISSSKTGLWCASWFGNFHSLRSTYTFCLCLACSTCNTACRVFCIFPCRWWCWVTCSPLFCHPRAIWPEVSLTLLFHCGVHPQAKPSGTHHQNWHQNSAAAKLTYMRASARCIRFLCHRLALLTTSHVLSCLIHMV